MIRAVLDTNTIVSGLGWGGPPGAVLDAALAANADVIVTGDQDLLTLGSIGQIQVLTPREFVESFHPRT